MSDAKLVLPTKLASKCVLCGHERDWHTAIKLLCPIGKRHRTLGFTLYHREQSYVAPTPEGGENG